MNDDGSPSVIAGSTVRRLPFVVNTALWAPDGAHLVVTTDDSIALLGLDGQGGLAVRADDVDRSRGYCRRWTDRRRYRKRRCGEQRDRARRHRWIGHLHADTPDPGKPCGPRPPRGRDRRRDRKWPAPSLEPGNRATRGHVPARGGRRDRVQPRRCLVGDDTVGEEQSVRLFDAGARELRLTLLPPDDLLGDGPSRPPGDTRCLRAGTWRSAATARCLPPRGVPVSGSLRLTSTNSWPSPVRTSLGR